MNKALPLLALILSLAALFMALLPNGAASRSKNGESVAHLQALEERMKRLETNLQVLESSQRRFHDRDAQRAGMVPGAGTVPTDQLQTRLEDLVEKQAELEKFTKSLDRLGIIESMEGEILKAHQTLLDTNLPVWTRAKQADMLKRYQLFGEEAVTSMMDLWNQTEDHNEKAAILYALSGVVATPEFRDQILASLSEEVRRDNPSPKFRHMAVEALEPMLPDPSVEQWLQYLAQNDPEPKLRARAGQPLGTAVPQPAKR